MNHKERKENLEATYKSMDTEEWLDVKFTRPIGYGWAVLFRSMGVHPNTVTVISIVIGAFAGYCFYHEELLWILLGITMLAWADILDSADGQLARMTGQKTLIGRILDGFAGDVWFFSIYFFIGLRLTPQPMPFGNGANWGVWIWVLMFVSGIICHKDQAGLADYYRNTYLFYKGDKSELSCSGAIRERRAVLTWCQDWFVKFALFFYVRYTERQEHITPQFQRMRDVLREKYGDELPDELRSGLCHRMYPLLKWTNILTFNTRAIVLYIVMLIGLPWLYFVFELTVMNVIFLYMRTTHERICRETANAIMRDDA